MTKEELKQKAEAEADKVIIGSGMDRTSVIHLKHLLVTMYIQGATKVTKELEAQIEKMKCCFNCRHSRTEYEHCRTDKHEKWEIKNENF